MIAVKNINKKYQSYYTDSDPIVNYMVNCLAISKTDKVLEPCGGEGVFIDAILKENVNQAIDIFEIDTAAIDILQQKFSEQPNINITESDTLFDNDLMLKSTMGGFYDKIIANPPYGAWQEYQKRKNLKKIFNGLYVKETYTLFLYKCIELLKNEGELVFIIPDTLLNLVRHKRIREVILEQTKIQEISLFPSSFFPGVNFGYANLCIIHLKKNANKSQNLNHEFRIKSGYEKVEDLGSNPQKLFRFKQNDILQNPDAAFYLVENKNVLLALQKINLTIGDIADCVTGFYSGNDKTFLKVKSKEIRNSKKYEVISEDLVFEGKINGEANIGITGNQSFVPIVKGGNTSYYKKNNWFMNWSKEAVTHYKTDKKARFQNPQYYFKEGIGIPMVSASRITASLIDNRLFDQSIVGVFPKDKNLTVYLLAFFNTPTCNQLIRTINPTANNPANYIKKIPIILGTKEEIALINSLVSKIVNDLKNHQVLNPNLQLEIETFFQKKYGF